jgi:hypothetical protein
MALTNKQRWAIAYKQAIPSFKAQGGLYDSNPQLFAKQVNKARTRKRSLPRERIVPLGQPSPSEVKPAKLVLGDKVKGFFWTPESEFKAAQMRNLEAKAWGEHDARTLQNEAKSAKQKAYYDSIYQKELNKRMTSGNPLTRFFLKDQEPIPDLSGDDTPMVKPKLRINASFRRDKLMQKMYKHIGKKYDDNGSRWTYLYINKNGKIKRGMTARSQNRINMDAASKYNKGEMLDNGAYQPFPVR